MKEERIDEKAQRGEMTITKNRLVDTLISLASRDKNVDAFVLCELCAKIGYTIQTEAAPDLPPSVKAIAVKLKGRYLILYRPSVFNISVQLSVLHELCHILLNHSSFTYEDIQRGKSFYTDEQEAEAERLSAALLSQLIDIKPEKAWWENILEEQASLSSPSIRRFMELAPKKRETAKSFRGSQVPLARIKQLFP
ncbi:MAG: M78 family metallopeptidase domain-containing protein [Planctomycetota bacterium]|jgi:hypothetical protein